LAAGAAAPEVGLAASRAVMKAHNPTRRCSAKGCPPPITAVTSAVSTKLILAEALWIAVVPLTGLLGGNGTTRDIGLANAS
jgi:hypothetical protein